MIALTTFLPAAMRASTISADRSVEKRQSVVKETTRNLACTCLNIAFNEIARQAIMTDPEYRNGNYSIENTNPDHGLGLARMIGHVTYLSDHGMGQKFGREVKSGDVSQARDVEFQVESYLRYKGQSFSKRFDANTYLLMTRRRSPSTG